MGIQEYPFRTDSISCSGSVCDYDTQGSRTLRRVILDLGISEFACGLTYVALTRVRSLKDIAFWPMSNFKRFTAFTARDKYKQKVRFLTELRSMMDNQ